MTDEDPTGGLTLDPPSPDHEASSGIGFAPDLSDDRSDDDRALFGNVVPSVDESTRYPRIFAVLASLLPALVRGPVDARSSTPARVPPIQAPHDEPPLSRPSGPAITRAPAPFVRPKDRTAVVERTEAKPGSEALMEMLLVGKNDAGAREAHFQFQEDVLGGMYLHLEHRPLGLFLRFTVGDDGDRRTLAAYVDELVARFEKKGTRVVGYEIVVGEADAR